MAKNKRSSKRPQPRHKGQRQASQHDKRKRLDCRNPERKKTTRAKVPLAGAAPGGPYHRTLLLVAGDHGAQGYLTALLCCCWWGRVR